MTWWIWTLVIFYWGGRDTDVDATYKGRDNTFIFWWFDKKIVLMPQSQSSENNLVTKKDKSLFTNITSLDFFKQVKEPHIRPSDEFSL